MKIKPSDAVVNAANAALAIAQNELDMARARLRHAEEQLKIAQKNSMLAEVGVREGQIVHFRPYNDGEWLSAKIVIGAQWDGWKAGRVFVGENCFYEAKSQTLYDEIPKDEIQKEEE